MSEKYVWMEKTEFPLPAQSVGEALMVLARKLHRAPSVDEVLAAAEEKTSALHWFCRSGTSLQRRREAVAKMLESIGRVKGSAG